MSDLQRFEYHVDLVMVIDATASMTPVLDLVKAAALGFNARLVDTLERSGKHVDVLRVRMVAFRDLADHGDQALAASPFFSLPADEPALRAWLEGITLLGGRTFAESGLAGLSVALHSPWTSGGSKRRHVTVLWTDDDAHLPENEHHHVPAAFQDQVAPSFDALTDMWHGSQYSTPAAKRLVVFAPDKGVWPDIGDDWENVIWFPSTAGTGLSDLELDEIVSAIANSI